MSSYAGWFGDRWHWRWGPDGHAGGDPAKARHTRAVLYLRNRFWVVFDRIESPRPRQIEALWHFHPDCAVAAEGPSVTSADEGKGNLRIVPFGEVRWETAIVKGQEEPCVQGWYSESYNRIAPSPCAVYAARVPRQAVFGWVLVPEEGRPPEARVETLASPPGSICAKVSVEGQPPVWVGVRLAEGAEDLCLDGMAVKGLCGVLRPGEPPLAACGSLLDANGSVVAADERDG